MFRRATAVLLAASALLTMPVAALAGPTLVVEASTGRVLHEEDATRPWYPASLSKLMTAYTVFKAVEAGRIDLGSPIVVSKRAARMAPSKMGYPPGTMVTVDDALKMLIVQSANDIAVALAEGVSGSVEAFAGEMNGHSRALGMTQSQWVNPNGLPDPRQISSARDMALLARALLTEFPEHQDLFGIQALQAGKRLIRTHNALVYRYPGADGMKTGFICASGFNVVATATRGGRRLIAVVLGSPSAKERTYEAAELFEDGFRKSGGGGGWFGGGGGATLASLRTSPYAAPTDIRDIACGKKKGGAARAEREDEAEVLPPTVGRKADGVMATLLANQSGAPMPRPADGPLLTSWQLAPPVLVGPYKGPLKPGQHATALAAVARPGAASYADTAPNKTLVNPAPPVAASLVPGLGAIRPGGGATDGAALPGQIPGAASNPLTALASDPMETGFQASDGADLGGVPLPVPRPALAPAKKKKKPKS